MTEADRIAIGIKFTIKELKALGATTMCVVLDRVAYARVTTNTEPCTPPDYDKEHNLFCGLPLVEATHLPPGDLLRCVGIRNLIQPPDLAVQESLVHHEPSLLRLMEKYLFGDL